MSKMLNGSSLLMGDSNIPGVQIHKEVREQLDTIFRECREFGMDFYPTIVEFVRYDEISELASYGGFPVRYPHWRFGMEYEGMSLGYEFGQHRISEMVVNTSPCVIYCLDSNSLVDNIDVIFHALGHNHFFKNNVFFAKTHPEGVMDKLANHGNRIRKYMARWGKESVTAFIDHCLSLETLIDPAEAWTRKEITEPIIRDERTYQFVHRTKPSHDYMDEWVNHPDRLAEQQKHIDRADMVQQLGLFTKPEKDVLRYLRDNAPLRPWQQDIISMLYEEALYFAPQRATKVANEGFASYIDHHFMCRRAMSGLGQPTPDAGIIEYARHKMLVLGGKYSQNPYKLGFELLLDIEDRWNKGRFGIEYDDCKDMREKERWDRKLGLGKDKVFDVIKHYNDAMLIHEFFTPEFCQRMEYFTAKKFNSGETKITGRDYQKIKKHLIQRHLNGGLPDIRLTDPNHRGRGWFLLEHFTDGRVLYDPYVKDVMNSIYRLWKNTVVLQTLDREGAQVVYLCDSPSNVQYMTRAQYESEYLK